MPPINQTQFIAKASVQLDKAQGVVSFSELLPDIRPILNVSAAADRWEFAQSSSSLTVGQTIRFSFPEVPRDELHEYHFLGMRVFEAGNKRFEIETNSPSPTAGLEYINSTFVVDGNIGSNFLNVYSLTAPDVSIRNPLILPPGFVISVAVLDGLVGGGPTNVGVMMLRRVSLPPFDVRQFTDINAVIT